MRKRKSRRTPVNVNYLLVFSDFLYTKRTINAPRKSTCRDRHRKTPASFLCQYLRIPTKPVVAIRLLRLSFRIARVNGAMLTPALFAGLHSIYSTSIEYTPNEHTARWLLYHITKPLAFSNFHFPILGGEADLGIELPLLRYGLT